MPVEEVNILKMINAVLGCATVQMMRGWYFSTYRASAQGNKIICTFPRYGRATNVTAGGWKPDKRNAEPNAGRIRYGLVAWVDDEDGFEDFDE